MTIHFPCRNLQELTRLWRVLRLQSWVPHLASQNLNLRRFFQRFRPFWIHSALRGIWQIVPSRMDFRTIANSFRGPLCMSLETSANEVSRWLVGLIEVATGKPVSRGLTSHGMKATTLAWMVKAGVSETTRLILGHHSLKELGTLETYGLSVHLPDSSSAGRRGATSGVVQRQSNCFCNFHKCSQPTLTSRSPHC